MMRSSEIRLLGVVALLVATYGCGGRYMRVQEKGMTCAEAHQAALTAVHRLGYEVVSATKPSPGSPGVITGTQGPEASKKSVLVQVFCTQLGAEVEAKAEGGGLGDLNFNSEFRHTLELAMASRPPVRKAAESGVDVLLTTERANNSDLGVDLTDLGVLPVSVRISNKTERAYGFRTRDVVLQTVDGERTKPLAVNTLKLDAAALATLQTKVLSDRDIAPQETLSGFLLFPFKSYTRARVTLTDREAGEPEGFAIEF
ncbi:MAG TPA: hypothetical protein VMT89_06465 [Candidatus Acidoferrales bacterium]|nr:hypothetical protein [Candidatus Acidoferrales bacterium]